MNNFAFNHSYDPLKCKDPDALLAFKEAGSMFIIYEDTLLPEKPVFVSVGEFHGRC
jgi:hypothetical protein